MLVSINTEVCFTVKITVNQYIILSLLYTQNYNTLNKLRDENDFESDFIDLTGQGYLLNDHRNCKLSTDFIYDRAKVNALFRSDDSSFWEFYSTYPIKVPGRGGVGTRMLRSVSIEAKETQVMKKKYESFVKKDAGKHKHIMKCLDAELFIRKKEGSLQFMQGIGPYLNQHSWTRYEGVLEQMQTFKKKTKYGEKLI